VGKGFSRQSITGRYRNGQPISEARLADAQRLQDELVDWLNGLPGSVVVIVNKPVEKLIAPRLRPGIKTGHFGALRGRNEWQGCDTIVVIGRDQPPPLAVESDARALYADDEEPLALTGEYETEERRLRMTAEGPPVTSKVVAHRDRRVQALLESYREREVEQAVDRARLIHNPTPKRVFILNDLVLDITVDEVSSWKELRHGGSRYARAWAATGILPTGAADLHRAHPDLWETVKAAGRALEKEPIKYPPFPNNGSYLEVGGIFRCSYRRVSQRGKASTVFLCQKRHPDPRAALEAVLGPLAEFAVIGGESVVPASGVPETACASQPACAVAAECVTTTQTGAPPTESSPSPPDPATWSAGVARLAELNPLPQWPADRWQRLKSDAPSFVSEWGETAARLGWTAYELFGVHCRAPYARVDSLGLVPLLNGGQVTELSATRAVIRLQSGHELTYRRKPRTHWPREAERALVWEDSVGVDQLRGSARLAA
jgi:hypothetical protein